MIRPREFAKKLIDPAIAVALMLGYLVLLLRTVDDLGYARDEGFYFGAAKAYAAWFELLGKDRHAALLPVNIDKYWSVNAEHPALMKSLFALSHTHLQVKRHLFAMEGTSFRFPAMFVSSGLIGVLYAWARRLHGRTAGVVAALSLGFMPRFFFNAHLACFDAPITAFFALAAFAYASSVRRGGFVGPILAGIAFGLALDTKHNAWFIPFAVVGHLVVVGVLALAMRAPLWRSIRRILANLGAMLVIGPLVFYALWPWIWHHTSERLDGYVHFHTGHEYYNMEFLGENYWQPPMPRAYAWVMTMATVPTIVLVLFAIGFAAKSRFALRVAWRRDAAALPIVSEWVFIAMCLGACYAPWLSTNTPIFGGTKHWMPAYPFLCLFVAAGFGAFCRGLVRLAARRRRILLWLRAKIPFAGALGGVVLAVVALVAPIRETLHAHPWGLSAYTPIVGGASGAATLGLNRTFWGYTTGSVVPILNRDGRTGSRVYIHDTLWPSWTMLQEDGRLRKDIVGVGAIEQSDIGLYHHELHMEGQEYQAWVAYETVAPKEVGGLDGVPVILVYERPHKRR